MAYKAIITGASGLIGSNLLDLLLQSNCYGEVLALSRRELPVKHKKLVQAIIDFDNLHNYQSLISGHALFCCLGTTQSKTPDLNIYKKIDHDYPVQLAQIAVKNNVPHYHFVSSIGADINATGFYLRNKGETERDIEQAGIKSLHIYRPSFLTGERPESRFTEKLAGVVLNLLKPALLGKLKKYRSISGETVARAMLNKSLINEEGVFIHPSDKIQESA